jgi:hypothetical protein
MSGINDKISGQDVLGLVLRDAAGNVKVDKLVDDRGESLTNEFVITREFNTAQEFSSWVQAQSKERRMTCMDVIIEYCTERDIDIEAVAVLINKVLKEKIRIEAEEAHLMRKTARLPI